MPDIDKLQELSDLFDVSIHELLAGERIGDPAQFRKTADKTLVSVLSEESAFNLEERIAFFKGKWLREHKGMIALWITGWLALCVTALFQEKPLLVALAALASIFIYGHIRNQMMIYVERRAFIPDQSSKEKS